MERFVFIGLEEAMTSLVADSLLFSRTLTDTQKFNPNRAGFASLCLMFQQAKQQ